jgi:hypothetical protein
MLEEVKEGQKVYSSSFSTYSGMIRVECWTAIENVEEIDKSARQEHGSLYVNVVDDIGDEETFQMYDLCVSYEEAVKQELRHLERKKRDLLEEIEEIDKMILTYTTR